MIANPLKAILENAVAVDRFSMAKLTPDVIEALPGEHFKARYAGMESSLGKKVSRSVFQGIVRASFFIELVKTPKIETTKFEVHWANRIDRDDPRYASYDDCFDIFEKATTALEAAIENTERAELLKLFCSKSLLPYEIPFDYIERATESQIHRADNVTWLWDDLPKRTAGLRSFLLNPNLTDPKGSPFKPFFDAAYNKIKVKTYLTDRVLTGAYKTNREKRWEAHPPSVHYALRRSCLEIEYTLINQLCHFDGFPDGLKQRLEAAYLLLPCEDPFRCPVTKDPLSFDEFKREVTDPKHGKASFQVGHLNPLKAINDDPLSGHSAQNIAWVSMDGNRIQGSLSLKETRELLHRINKNYERLDIWKEVVGQMEPQG